MSLEAIAEISGQWGAFSAPYFGRFSHVRDFQRGMTEVTETHYFLL